jgi:hypothetical protein
MAPLQKQCRVQFSGENFRLYEAHSGTFLLTGDEMWIFYWHPKIKQWSMQWIQLIPLLPESFEYNHMLERS